MTPTLLLAGLPPEVANRVADQIPATAVQVGSGAELLAELGRRAWGLVVLDSALRELPNPDVLRSALGADGSGGPVLFFASRQRLDAATARTLVDVLGVRRLLYHPLDAQELARQAADALGVEVGARPAAAAERRAELGAAMAGMWDRFRGAIFARLDVLEEAAVALLEGTLDDELRQRAVREAHKLAGSVGTFGFADGSRLAREIEGMLEGSAPLPPSHALLLSDRVVALRGELERPPPPAPTAAAEAAGEVDGEMQRLLIVDADRDLAGRLAMEAGPRGLRVEIAPGVAEARLAVRRERPEIVLLDLATGADPGMALDLLNELASQAPPIPTVVLAAEGSLLDRVEVARMGGRGFLQKPITPSRVIEVVREVLERGEVPAPTVMTVDDDPLILETVRLMLEPRGYQLVTLDDPLRFWEVLETARPDLLVLDVDMPHLTGIELCRVVRNDPRLDALPIVFLTARTDADTVQRIFASGADDYVVKPVAESELITRLDNRLARARHVHTTSRGGGGPTGLVERGVADEVMSRVLRLAAREERPYSLAVVEVDGFAEINARHGSTVADGVLARLAKILLRTVRADDVVSRWQGAELVIGMFGVEKGEAVALLAGVGDRLREEEFASPAGEVFRVALSGGVAEFPREGSEVATLHRTAAEALGRARQEGGGRVLGVGWSAEQGWETESVDVLLVDDDTVLAGLLLHALATRGYRTHWIDDGEAAVQALSGAQPAVRARVILLDVDLPGLHGLGVLGALAREHVLLRSRVIMLTARSGEEEVLKALDLGATDHVAKPFSVPVLLQRVRRALDGERAT